MSTTIAIESSNSLDPSADLNKAAQMAAVPEDNISDMERNKWIQDRREWIARARDLGGQVKGLEVSIKNQTFTQIKYGINATAGALRAAFSYKNPMALIGGVFQAGMNAFELTAAAFSLSKDVKKKKDFEGFLRGHAEKGVTFWDAGEMTSKSGELLHVPDWTDVLKGTLDNPAVKGKIAEPKRSLDM